MYCSKDFIVIISTLIHYSWLVHYSYSLSKPTILTKIKKDPHTPEEPKHTCKNGRTEVWSSLPLAVIGLCFLQLEPWSTCPYSVPNHSGNLPEGNGVVATKSICNYTSFFSFIENGEPEKAFCFMDKWISSRYFLWTTPGQCLLHLCSTARIILLEFGRIMKVTFVYGLCMLDRQNQALEVSLKHC